MAKATDHAMSPVRRIAIVGAESTGKSWLAESLTRVLTQRGETVQWVPEVLRSWCEREGRTPEPHEQMAIAQSQAEAVLSIQQGIVISDTTPLMTAVYSVVYFDDDSLLDAGLEDASTYDAILPRTMTLSPSRTTTSHPI